MSRPSRCAGHKRLSAKPVPSNILFHRINMDKIVSKLYFLFDSIKRSLPEQKARWIEKYLEANERGLALESILEYKREFDIPVDNHFREAARYCGDQMRIGVEPYL
jgi:hypothetical protein